MQSLVPKLLCLGEPAALQALVANVLIRVRSRCKVPGLQAQSPPWLGEMFPVQVSVGTSDYIRLGEGMEATLSEAGVL